MGFSILKLISNCKEELQGRGYSSSYLRVLESQWNAFSQWFIETGFSVLTEDVVNEYCILKTGTFYSKGLNDKEKEVIRATRMLLTFYEYEDFEFRSPLTAPKVFIGEDASFFDKYIIHLKEIGRSNDTISYYKTNLWNFNNYMVEHGLKVEDITTDIVEDFISASSLTPSLMNDYRSKIKNFLKFCYDEKLIKNDLSSVVIRSPKAVEPKKLPTVYTEEEIKRILEGIDRTSAKGKRDYLIILLAAVYGLRASDITHLKFNQIDWEKNKIYITQQKTKHPLEFSLVASVGNAIIDYIQHGRPNSDNEEIILSHEQQKKGNPITEATIHSIVSDAISRVIPNYKERKHGPHALRHSLATNLLEKNVAMPMIKTILGHQSTETTKIYLGVNFSKLKLCSLPIPKVTTPYYD